MRFMEDLSLLAGELRKIRPESTIDQRITSTLSFFLSSSFTTRIAGFAGGGSSGAGAASGAAEDGADAVVLAIARPKACPPVVTATGGSAVTIDAGASVFAAS